MNDSIETKRADTPRDNQEDTELASCERWHSNSFGIPQKDDGSPEWHRGGWLNLC